MRDVPLQASQKETSEQPEGRRAVGTAQGRQKGTEYSEMCLLPTNVSFCQLQFWNQVTSAVTYDKASCYPNSRLADLQIHFAQNLYFS